MAINITNKLPEIPVVWNAERDRIMWALDMDRAEIATESSTLADIVDLSDTGEDITVNLWGRRLPARLMPIVLAMIEDPDLDYPAREAVHVTVTPGQRSPGLGHWSSNGDVAIIVDAAVLMHMSISSTVPADQWGCRLLEALISGGPIDLAALLTEAHPRLVAAFAAYITEHAAEAGEPAPLTV